MSLNLNKAYIAKLCKLTGISQDQFEFYYRKALARLSCCDPVKDVAIIAKTMRYMTRKYEYKPPEPKPQFPKYSPPYPGQRSLHRFSADEIADVIKRYKNNELLKNIAEVHKVSVSSISELAKRSGLPRRKQGPKKYFSESERP
jgi:hypothetical protein